MPRKAERLHEWMLFEGKWTHAPTCECWRERRVPAFSRGFAEGIIRAFGFRERGWLAEVPTDDPDIANVLLKVTEGAPNTPIARRRPRRKRPPNPK